MRRRSMRSKSTDEWAASCGGVVTSPTMSVEEWL
jgi:hypothetical protein